METVLITGAARRVGSLIAEDLASRGCFVWIHSHTHEQEARDLCEKIRQNGGLAGHVKADLTDINQIDRMLTEILESGQGQLTTLINNASVFQTGTLRETDTLNWDKTMNTNLKAVWYLSVQFTSRFPKAKRILTIGDASAESYMPQHGVYALSKHALKFLTEQMAIEFAPDIRVNLLSPGLVLKSDFETQNTWDNRQRRTLLNNDEIVESILAGIRFLMQDPGMTGADLIIDNGFRFRTGKAVLR